MDQGTATLVAALIAAVASVFASLAALVPMYREHTRTRARQRRLKDLLAGEEPLRSLEWLARRLGVSTTEVAAMLPDIDAHGVLMDGDKEGAALDSRHQAS